MTRLTLQVALILALLMSIGCSSPSSGPASDPAPAKSVEVSPQAAASPAAGKSPCQLVSKADLEEAVGMPVADPKPNSTNPSVCDFKVGDLGNVSFMLRPATPGQTKDRMMEESRKANLNPVEAPGIGDFSFFASPGYGMTQLNSFKGTNYVIITMLVPKLSAEKQQAAAEQLMKKALANL